MKSNSGFRGIYPIVYALFDDTGALSREAMRRQVLAMLTHKVHGIGVLGLASEVNKLSGIERRELMEWVLEDVAGAVPVAVTVAEPSKPAQIEFAKAAFDAGAAWLVLQPPPVKGVPESELIRFFGAVADRSSLPIAVQNAPEYLGVGLSIEGLAALHRAHPNVALVKLEASAIAVRRLFEALDGRIDIFNGRAGLEIIASLQAGAVGIMPGGETFDILVKIYDDMQSEAGDGSRAHRLYADLAPTLVFLMESMDNFLVYGKRILGHRLGVEEVEPRDPYSRPTDFGLQLAQSYAAALGKL